MAAEKTTYVDSVSGKRLTSHGAANLSRARYIARLETEAGDRAGVIYAEERKRVGLPGEILAKQPTKVAQQEIQIAELRQQVALLMAERNNGVEAFASA